MRGMDASSQASAQSRLPVGRLAALAMFVALAAATLAGSCTGYADESGSGVEVLTAALIAGGGALALSLAFILRARSWPGVKLLTVVSVASYLAAGFGAWWLLLWPAVVALIIAVTGGLVAHPIAWPGPGPKTRYAGTAVIATFATAVSAVIVVIGFWANYDVNFGWFDGSDGPAELNVIPFALVCGAVPPIAGALAAWLSNSFSDTEPDSGPPARPIPQASTATSAKLILGVAVCFAVVLAIGAVNAAFRFGIIGDANFLFQLVLGFLMSGGIVAMAGGLMVKLTLDYRELWLFAVILISSSVVGIIGMREGLNAGLWQMPWQIAMGLAAAAIGGVVAAYTARRQFHAGGSAMLSVGFASVIGILLVANSSRPLAFLLNSPLLIDVVTENLSRPVLQVALSSFNVLLSVAAAAVTAHLIVLLCRR